MEECPKSQRISLGHFALFYVWNHFVQNILPGANFFGTILSYSRKVARDFDGAVAFLSEP